MRVRTVFRPRFAIPLAAIALITLFTVLGATHSTGRRTSASGLAKSGQATSAAKEAQSSTLHAADGGTVFGQAIPAPASGATARSDTSTSSSSGDLSFDQPPPVAGKHYLVRTGDMTIVVKRATLFTTVDRITTLTTAMGGYVVSSAVGTLPDSVVSSAVGTLPGSAEPEPQPLDAQQGATGKATITPGQAAGEPYATVTVRVPARDYDKTVRRFSALGDVKQVDSSSDDVTSQYVDLQARLDHYRAVEHRLLSFLSAATNVSQALAVQDRIDHTQLTVEELSAQIKELDETTTYSTLTVSLSENRPPAASHIGKSGSFTAALTHSLRLLVDGAQVAVVALGALLPFLALIAIAVVVIRIVWQRFGGARRRPQSAAPLES